MATICHQEMFSGSSTFSRTTRLKRWEELGPGFQPKLGGRVFARWRSSYLMLYLPLVASSSHQITHREQIDFCNRFLDWNVAAPSCIIDGFDVRIREPLCNTGKPYSQKKYWYSYKYSSPALRYVIAVHCESAEVLWVSRAYPGATSELRITEELDGLLLDEEKMLGDRLFRFNNRFICAEAHYCEYSRNVDSMRSLVERRIRVIRNFTVASSKWRGTSNETFEFHQQLMLLICQISNLCWNK